MAVVGIRHRRPPRRYAGALVLEPVEEVACLVGTVIATTEVIHVKCVQPVAETTDDTQDALWMSGIPVITCVALPA